MMQAFNTQYHKRPQYILIIFFGLTMVLNGLYAPATVQCEEQKVIPEWIMPKHYPPDGFDGYGLIDRISREEVVIDDDLFKLARWVKYATPTNKSSSHSNLKVGDMVGYLKNPEHEIISIWLIETNKL